LYAIETGCFRLEDEKYSRTDKEQDKEIHDNNGEAFGIAREGQHVRRIDEIKLIIS
jgi:hypothetical protein